MVRKVACCALLALLTACSQGTPEASGPVALPPITAVPAASPAASLEARFNPTAAVGGGANASGALTAEQLQSVFAAVQQATQLRITGSANPPGATGAAVTSVSMTAQDMGGVLKSLDPAGKKALGEALLIAAGSAWPNASISMLVTDPSGASGQIIGSRPPGGPNTVFAT